MARVVKNSPANAGRQKRCGPRSVGWEDSLESGMATHFSFLLEEYPWTEEPGGSIGSQSQTRLKWQHARKQASNLSSAVNLLCKFCWLLRLLCFICKTKKWTGRCMFPLWCCSLVSPTTPAIISSVSVLVLEEDIGYLYNLIVPSPRTGKASLYLLDPSGS